MDFVKIFFIAIVSLSCNGQREPSLPLSSDSFRQILRTKVTVPPGRSLSFNDIIIRHYSTNTTKPRAYRIRDVKRLLVDPNFDAQRPTVLYAHGYYYQIGIDKRDYTWQLISLSSYVELYTDESVQTVTRAYLHNGGYNVLLLDWSNLAFGNYVVCAMDVEAVGNVTGRVVSRLLKGGLSLDGLHLVGHSLGAHVLGATARYLAARELVVPRLTGLDPAYPGFYPPLLGRPLSPEDAAFVDVVHTDAGGFGAPGSTGQADFWPNEGKAKQPGCLSATVPLTFEDFCSHWRSWRYWAESLTGGEFLARQCDDYDSFVRGQCREAPLVPMGIKADAKLNGNFYLRTAAMSPFSLGERGAE